MRNRREILKIENLKLSFTTPYQKIAAVKGASLDLNQGECLAIVGESGCGKSALVKSILQLNPTETTVIESGRILYQGKDLIPLSEKDMRDYRGQEIGMVFQDPMASLNPTMRVGEQIEESIILKDPNLNKDQVYDEVISLFKLVGIPAPEKRYSLYPFELSGGMRQRVMIAIALAGAPKILILDEPTTALDVTIQAQILDQLKKIQKKLSMSIIFITHNLSLVSGFCDRILVMYGGHIVEEADSTTLFTHPRHPYTQKLLASIPSLSQSKDSPLLPIKGNPPSACDQITGCMFHPRCPYATKICSDKSPVLKKDNDRAVACHHVKKEKICDDTLVTVGEST